VDIASGRMLIQRQRHGGGQNSSLRRFFHSSPRMEHLPVGLGHGEIVPATAGLIVSSGNRDLRIVAEQKRAHGAVPNEEHITRPMSAQDALGLAHDTRLSIDGSFPSANTSVGIGKELVRHAFKFVWRQETRG
jgi:hypothetical protein